jgi:hypothetical protein
LAKLGTFPETELRPIIKALRKFANEFNVVVLYKNKKDAGLKETALAEAMASRKIPI